MIYKQLTRKDQPYAWVVFEKKTGMFIGFFFDEDMANKYLERNPDSWAMEKWLPLQQTIDVIVEQLRSAGWAKRDRLLEEAAKAAESCNYGSVAAFKIRQLKGPADA